MGRFAIVKSYSSRIDRPPVVDVNGENCENYILCFGDGWFQRSLKDGCSQIPTFESITIESVGKELEAKQKKALAEDVKNLMKSYGITQEILSDGVAWTEVNIPVKTSINSLDYIKSFASDIDAKMSRYGQGEVNFILKFGGY